MIIAIVALIVAIDAKASGGIAVQTQTLLELNKIQLAIEVQQSIISTTDSGEVLITSTKGTYFVTSPTTWTVTAEASNWNVTHLRVNLGDYIQFIWSAFDTVNLVASDWATVLQAGPSYSMGGNYTFRVTTPGPNYFVAATKGFQLLVDVIAIGSSSSGLTGPSVVPVGGIILWSGSTSSVPDSYALCNGQTIGGVTTPNLSGQFVVGVGSNGQGESYSMGQTGGNDQVVLSTNQIPSHQHNYQRTDVGFDSTISFWDANAGLDVFVYPFGAGHQRGNRVNLATSYAHNTDSTASQGSGQAFDNRPSYYVLAYIMRYQ